MVTIKDMEIIAADMGKPNPLPDIKNVQYTKSNKVFLQNP